MTASVRRSPQKRIHPHFKICLDIIGQRREEIKAGHLLDGIHVRRKRAQGKATKKRGGDGALSALREFETMKKPRHTDAE